MKTVALLGTGLMGASIGLALRARGVELRVQAYARRGETRRRLLDKGIADAVFETPAEAVKDADLVIACVPVCTIPQIVRAAAEGLKPGAVVTDVGSTKQWLAGECGRILEKTDAVFVGSHPMCGSEKTGIGAADADLYRDAVCVVCAEPDTREKVWLVSQFWTRLGCRVVEMPAAEHDELAARGSHVPHVAASALVLSVFKDPERLKPLIGPGFRDTTRVAAGSPGLWRDIVGTNPQPVAQGLRALQQQIGEFADAVEAMNLGRVEALLGGAVEAREWLCGAPEKTAESSEAEAQRVIAIDGPSASGKSTVAKKVAARMGALYVDSGAMYRGMTWKVLREGANPEDEEAVRAVMAGAEWTFPVREGAVRFAIDGVNPGEDIRGEAVRETVSYVARIPEVRRFIVEAIRGMRVKGSLVVEGRDIGSVVFPETPHKFYLDADPAERARRRNAELLATESGTSVEAVCESLSRRDHLDRTRKTAPLQVAEGAKVVDTTHLTLDEVVERIVQEVG